MKKLMIILLIGILTLGLSGVVYADNQTIQVTVATAVSITTPPSALEDTDIISVGDWTDVTKTIVIAVSYTHLRAHETRHDLVCRLLLAKKKNECYNYCPAHHKN